MNNIIEDKKVKCYSAMEMMTISKYLEIVDKVYANKGGIQGQRDALKQKTAITIRNRMIDDISKGAILPPVVIGVIVSEDIYDNFKEQEFKLEFLDTTDIDNICIIDGMQRTTAIKKALEVNPDIVGNSIRVEFWISQNVNSLIYRMLVLNTGQVPWNIRRQIEIVFSGILNVIRNTTSNINIIEIDDGKRRKKGGEYNANDLIEMFLAFGARTWKIDTKEKLADEFTRGDFVQSSSETDLVSVFCKVLSVMAELDIELDNKVTKNSDSDSEKKRFEIGRDLFSSTPAKIGFATACGIHIFGRPGENMKDNDIERKYKEIEEAVNKVINSLKSLSDVQEYIDFETLSDLTGKKVSRVGDYEREMFYRAFKTLFELHGDFDTLTVCWRSN